MNDPHPSPEDLVRWFGHELPPDRHAVLQSHVDACPECRTRVAGWRQAGHRLDGWTVPLPRPRAQVSLRTVHLGWAAAVLLALLAGYLAGRPVEAPSQRAAHATVTPDAPVPADASTRLLAEQMQRLRLEQDQRFRQLRRDLETLAITTEAALRQGKLDLLQVSQSTRPQRPPTP